MKTWKQFVHVCGARPIFRFYTKFSEERIKVITPRDQDSNTDSIILEKSAKCEQISIKSLIFTIPFKIKCYPSLKIINLVSVLKNFHIVGNHFRPKVFLHPPYRTKNF